MPHSMLATLFCLAAALPVYGAETGRWYQADQVKQGAEVFSRHCATCHGERAEATPDWRKLDPDGKYPPPPLNGTAHAWHHPLYVLRQVIRDGGAAVGGKMPPFGDVLHAAEIDAAIAYFQSFWSDEIYAAWLRQHRPPR